MIPNTTNLPSDTRKDHLYANVLILFNIVADLSVQNVFC